MFRYRGLFSRGLFSHRGLFIGVFLSLFIGVFLSLFIGVFFHMFRLSSLVYETCLITLMPFFFVLCFPLSYGVATISRIDQITGLLFRI